MSERVKAEPEYLTINYSARIEGVLCVVVDCQDFDHFKRLPQVVSYNGTLLGKTGWSSDTNIAHYQSNAHMVRVVR
jgi:hypothetical protein